MPLNTSGPISLAGATTGESIAVELGLSASGNISLNQADVRALAGVPSGAITMPTNFYGKSAGSGYTVGLVNSGGFITRINACGALIGNNTNAATNTRLAASGTSCNVGVFYECGAFGARTVARMNSSGALVGSLTNVGTARGGPAGARAGANLLVVGGYYFVCCSCYSYEVPTCLVTRINGSGALVGSESTITGVGFVTAFNSWAAATSTSSNVIFYGNGTNLYRVNSCGVKVGSTTSAGSLNKASNAGAQIGANACRNGGVSTFYAGIWCAYNFFITNSVTRINACGALVGSVTNVGTARWRLSGMTIGSSGIFFGGNDATYSCGRRMTRINVCGAIVGSEVAPLGAYGFEGTGGSASYT